jgi:hypothetical protein
MSKKATEFQKKEMSNAELQLKSLEKVLIARRAWSSYETCFVISFLINHKTGNAIRRCLSDQNKNAYRLNSARYKM